MSKRLIKEIKPYCDLYIDDKTGIAWIENGSTGTGHSVHPNIDSTGSVRGMKQLGYWGKDDKIVRSHGWQYNISKFVASDELDKIVADYCQCEECKKRRQNAKEKSGVEELLDLRKQLLEQVDDYEVEYRMSGHHAITTRILQLNDIISTIQKRCEEIDPMKCDW